MAAGTTGGYDCDFVEEIPDEDICVICNLVLKDPLQLEGCGHCICKTCYNKLAEHAENRGEDLLCPFDRVKIIPNQVFRDKKTARKILDFKVRCGFKAKDCAWVGELRQLKDHEETCPKNNPLTGVLDEIDVLKSKVEQLEIKMAEKDQEIKDCKETIKCLQNKENEMMKTLEETNKKLTDQLAEKNNHIKNREDKNRKQNEVIKTLENNSQKQNEVIKTLENNSQKQNEVIKRLENNSGKQNELIKTLENNSQKQNKEIKSLETTVNELANQLKNYGEKIDNSMIEKSKYEWVADYNKLLSSWQDSEEFCLSTIPYSFQLAALIGNSGLYIQLRILPGENKTPLIEVRRRLKGIKFEVYVKGKDGGVHSEKVTVDDDRLRVGSVYAYFIWDAFQQASDWEQWMHNDKLHIWCKIE